MRARRTFWLAAVVFAACSDPRLNIPDRMWFEDDGKYFVVSPTDSQFTYYRRQVELSFLDGTPDSMKLKLFAKYRASVVGGSVYAGSYFLKMSDPGPTFADYRNRILALRAELGVRAVSAAERTSAPPRVDYLPPGHPTERK